MTHSKNRQRIAGILLGHCVPLSLARPPRTISGCEHSLSAWHWSRHAASAVKKSLAHGSIRSCELDRHNQGANLSLITEIETPQRGGTRDGIPHVVDTSHR